jgi:hypothetical protein
MHCFVCGTRFAREAWECGTCKAPLPRESRIARYEAEERRARDAAPAPPRPTVSGDGGAPLTGPARLRVRAWWGGLR